MKRKFRFLLISGFCLRIVLIGACQPPSSNWILIPEICDEFNGSSLASTKWLQKPGHSVSGVFAFKYSNMCLFGGYLKLTARKEEFNNKSYTSSFLESKICDPGNGSYHDVRARTIDLRANICYGIWEQNFPINQANNPNPEIDIQEYLLPGAYWNPNRVQTTLHRWPSRLGVHTQDAYQMDLPENSIPKTEVLFKTSDLKLQMIFDEAEKKAKLNLNKFGKYQVLVEGGGYNNVWLETQPMGGMMYAKRNLLVAKNNIQIFMDFQRDDGRFPGMITYENNILIPHYGWFQGFCFPMPAFETYFWLNKDKNFLLRLYGSLERFDNYLWKTRDSDKDGCLETWCVFDTGEDNCTRFGSSPNSWPFDFPPSSEKLSKMSKTELAKYCNISHYDTIMKLPVPIESMDIMSYSYTCRDVLYLISKELGNGKEDYWKNKAINIRKKVKSYLWDEAKHACYDRDRTNKIMNILLHNNIRCMYYNTFDQQMADDFIKYHLLNPAEFWTPMPLTSIAANDSSFRNVSGNDWSGQPQGLTFQRSINALENYGHYAELTMIGTKFLKVIGDSLKFTQQFNPFNGTIDDPWKRDSYGPSILASLEFISRLYGVYITQEKIYWSCIDINSNISYSQKWGSYLFELTTNGNQVFCSINGKEVFSFTKGIRVISDLNGKLLEVVGIEINEKKADIGYDGKTFSISVTPNTIYGYKNKFYIKKSVEFYKPDN